MQLKIISRSNSFSSVCIDDNMFIVINETVNLHEKSVDFSRFISDAVIKACEKNA